MIIKNNLSLVAQKVNHDVKVEVSHGTNFYFAVDISGSMSGELQKIRTQLKNKLSTLLKDDDRISIIWFASDNQCGVLQESVQVSNLEQLSKLHNAIDKYLKPMGCTAFRKPLQLVEEIIKRSNSANPNALIFLTDGYNNDCNWKDVLTNLKALEPLLTSTTFVEYGYYADSKRLQELSELVGGEKITSSSFDQFDKDFSKKLSTPLISSKKTKVDLPHNNIFNNLAFAVTDTNEIVSYNCDSNSILVPCNVNEVLYLVEANDDQTVSETALYVAGFILANKLMVDEAELILAKTGDVKLVKDYSVAYGKQKLFEFIENLKQSIEKPEVRFVEGKSDSIVVDDNAYCLLDLISDLQQLNAKFYPFNSNFQYNRISCKTESKSPELTDDIKEELSKAATLQDAQNILSLFKDNNKPLEFVIGDRNVGYDMTDLVYNEKRANLSIKCRVDGYVQLKENQFKLDKIDTFRYFTFNIVCDGMVNVGNLVVSLDAVNESHGRLFKYLCNHSSTVPINDAGETGWNIDIASLPIINRSMYKSLSAVELANLEYELRSVES